MAFSFCVREELPKSYTKYVQTLQKGDDKYIKILVEKW